MQRQRGNSRWRSAHALAARIRSELDRLLSRKAPGTATRNGFNRLAEMRFLGASASKADIATVDWWDEVED